MLPIFSKYYSFFKILQLNKNLKMIAWGKGLLIWRKNANSFKHIQLTTQLIKNFKISIKELANSISSSKSQNGKFSAKFRQFKPIKISIRRKQTWKLKSLLKKSNRSNMDWTLNGEWTSQMIWKKKLFRKRDKSKSKRSQLVPNKKTSMTKKRKRTES